MESVPGSAGNQQAAIICAKIKRREDFTSFTRSTATAPNSGMPSAFCVMRSNLPTRHHKPPFHASRALRGGLNISPIWDKSLKA
jgi:hypothetical protein